MQKTGSTPGSEGCSGGGNGKDALEEETAAAPAFPPGEPHGRRNLAGCSAWGHEESDTAERRSTHANIPIYSLFPTESVVKHSPAPAWGLVDGKDRPRPCPEGRPGKLVHLA